MADHKNADGDQALWRKVEIARFCRVSIRTIENWMAAEGLPHFKIGNVVLFKPADVKSFLESHYRSNPR